MRKFTLGEKYAAVPKTEENYKSGVTSAAFREHTQELMDKIGIDYLGGPGPVHHLAEQDGYFFVNDFPDHNDSPYTHIDKTPFHPLGEVMCGDCGGFEFRISYGSYECFGTCMKCDHKYSLYSG